MNRQLPDIDFLWTLKRLLARAIIVNSVYAFNLLVKAPQTILTPLRFEKNDLARP